MSNLYFGVLMAIVVMVISMRRRGESWSRTAVAGVIAWIAATAMVVEIEAIAKGLLGHSVVWTLVGGVFLVGTVFGHRWVRRRFQLGSAPVSTSQPPPVDD